MGAKGEALAEQLEGKIRQAIATLKNLNDADWKKVTDAEKWPVGVTAHHFASALESVSKMVAAVAAGQAPNLTKDMIDQMNAKHAEDHAECTKEETIELLKRNSAVAAGVIRGLSNDQLAKSGMVMDGAPPMTPEQLFTLALLNHLDDHFGSIRKAVGK